LNWTTPTIDRLAGEGVKLENYFTLYSCVPARGAFLTGRYPIRLGLWNQFDGAELPLSEITIGQEMQSAGYRTYLVGKWHQGFSTIQKTPAYRGFDSSYSYWNGFVDYWSKTYGLYLDLHNGEDLVTDADEVSSDLHNGILMETKAEAAIADHAANYSGQPMFLYYAMQLIHGVWDAPDSYLKRCGMPEGIADEYVRNVTYNYCALNVMLDEAVANLTCALEAHGMANNTILVLVSDNGGEQTVLGNSYPYIGNKGSFYRGGLSATGFIHSKLIPEAARGVPYYGQMHVTDWLPTLMGLATNNEWTGSLFGAELDGVDQWEAITVPGTDSPRHEIVHYHDGNSTSSIQIDMMKLNLGDELKPASNPSYVFTKDLAPENSAQTCALPSLIDDDESIFSHNLQSKVLELDISPTMQSSSGIFFSGYVAVAFIVFLITLVILMSIRMASVIGKQVDEIEVDRKRQERERVAEDGPHAGETSRLLI
jgi:arylsulfatase A-like enzyme